MVDQIHKKFNRKQVKIHRGFSKDVADEFPDEYFDWIYVDGNHSYNGVMSDLTLYYPKMKIGGLIVGDDYNIKMTDRVKRAVKEFTASKGLKFQTKKNQYWFRRV